MRWTLRKVALVLGVSTSLALLGTSAYAATPSPISGSWTLTLTPQSVTSSGGNSFIVFTFAETISGSFSGTRTGEGRFTIHPDGTVNAHEEGTTFAGTYAGRTGTAAVAVEASGTFASLTGSVLLSDGSAGLTGIHAVVSIAGTATSSTSFAGTYEGQVQFEP